MQQLGNGRRDLAGIAVAGPLAREHQIHVPQFGNGCCQDPSRSQGVGPCHPFIGSQDAPVSPHGDAFPEDFPGQGGAHGDQDHFTADLVLDSQSRLNGMDIHRVQLRGSPHPHQVMISRADFNVRNRRYLFYQYNRLHTMPSFMIWSVVSWNHYTINSEF